MSRSVPAGTILQFCITLLLLSAANRPLHAQSAPANPLGLSIHHATASVANLEKESLWYQHIFGFQRGPRLGSGGFLSYQMTMPGTRIDLVWQKGSARHGIANDAAEQGWLHIVFNTKDVAQTYLYLKQKGTDVKAYRDKDGKIQHLALHDPEGNEIGIAGD
ncbi:VOC family protein [Silvibacterium acidisoli]|uniref:VOC family protein n=1 Tax=Acidobacteriaceae bacterium ZG23-2 TaxID=2883246 RepID=UPI00406D47E6